MEEREEMVGEALPEGVERGEGVEAVPDGTEVVLEADGEEVAASVTVEEAEGDEEERAEGEMTSDAPRVPWGISLNDAAWFFTRLPDGSRILQFNPVQRHPQLGAMAMPPGVSMYFSAEGWAMFQRDVENDGVKPKVQPAKPAILKATQMPRPQMERRHPRRRG